jgi:hypothetical protein
MMIIGIFFISISLIFGVAEAGSNWLDKGKDLLKTYGGKGKKAFFAGDNRDEF